MPYSQYKESGRSLGRILHQLYKIGIPLRIVEEVILGTGQLTYGNEPFATFTWTDNDVPVFKFVNEVYTAQQVRYLFIPDTSF